jgi:hypothetical protein
MSDLSPLLREKRTSLETPSNFRIAAKLGIKILAKIFQSISVYKI